MQKPNTEIGNYIVIKTLGAGTTGKVKLAQNKDDGQLVAIKIIKKSNFQIKPNLERKIQREIALMRLLDHPHIMKLIDVFESERHLHLVLEYAENGELFDYLVRSQSLREDQALDIFRQLIFGLDYLHSHNICHRDLKPENILLDSNMRIKIADFGFARWMRENIAETSCGSPHYAAPEVIKGHPYDGLAADIWSVGVILFALLAGYLPFDDPSIRNLLAKVKRGKFTMPDFPPEIQDLIRGMMQVDPESRFTMEQIKSHPAFLYSLPVGYIVPLPIAVPDLNDPIDPATVDGQMIQNLAQIGIAPEESNEALVQTGTNVVKLFLMMMTRRIQLDQLPWDTAHKTVTTDDGMVRSISGDGFGAGQIGINIQKRKMLPDVSSPDQGGFSLATRQNWLIEEPSAEFEYETEVGQTSLPLPHLMWELQKVVVECGFQFFHPDDMLILCKNENETFMNLQAVYIQTDVIQVNLRMNNVTGDLRDMVLSKLHELLSQTDFM